MIFYSLRVNAHKGAVMTSFGRSYEKEMKGNYNAGTTSLLYLAYGDGYLNRACNGLHSFGSRRLRGAGGISGLWGFKR